MLDNTGVFLAFILPGLLLLGCPFFFIPFYFLRKKNKTIQVLFWVFFVPWLVLVGLIVMTSFIF